jgi:superfamily II DNA or RNA helicase
LKKTRTVYAYSAQSWYEARIEAGKTPYLKIGDTKRLAEDRVAEQDKTGNPEPLDIKATFEIPFHYRDYQIHSILEDLKVIRLRNNREWFECDVDMVQNAVNQLLYGVARPDSYRMRKEQENAVEMAFNYYMNTGKDFLFNAKMRFGKVFASYQLMKKMQNKNVLILTYKPSVDVEWHNGLVRHVDFEGYDFYHALDFNKDNPIKFKRNSKGSVLFASFQDILGTDLKGSLKKKWLNIFNRHFDLVIIDEVHFGAKTSKAIDLINKLNYDYKLELSGTPLELLMSGEYSDENTFTWSYLDEQLKRKEEEKKGWKTEVYKWLPPLNIYTYELGEEIIKHLEYYTVDEGLTLNKFFAANDDLIFINDAAVDNFLDLLASPDEKVFASPFNNNRIKKHLNHMFWYFDRVNSVKAMRKKLESHSYFKQYKIVTAANDNDGEGRDTLDLVNESILRNPKTITLSCGKLNTGVTVPQWNAEFMFCDTEAAESYWQTAFRVQSPNKDENKQECFLFDFNPNRTLKMVYDYAEHLAKTDQSTPQAIRELLDVMKVFAYRDNKLVNQDESFIEQIINCGINPQNAIKKFESKQMASISKVDDKILEILKNIPPQKGDKLSLTVVESKINKGKNFKIEEKKPKKDKSVELEINKIIAKLLNVIQKVPTFMFLSIDIEEDLKHLLKTSDADLFELTIGISLANFKYLIDSGFLSKKLLDRAIQSYYLATREVA